MADPRSTMLKLYRLASAAKDDGERNSAATELFRLSQKHGIPIDRLLTEDREREDADRQVRERQQRQAADRAARRAEQRRQRAQPPPPPHSMPAYAHWQHTFAPAGERCFLCRSRLIPGEPVWRHSENGYCHDDDCDWD